MSFIVREATSFDEIRDEWAALEPQTAVRLPFSHPRWSELWWKHFAERNLLVSDSLRLLAVRDRGGALKGVAPFVLTRRSGLPVLSIRSFRVVRARPAITELSTSLVSGR